MIISIDESRVAEAAQFASEISQMKKHKCKACADEYDKLLSSFTKRVRKPDDEVLICTENNEILGALALLVEPKEKYIEVVSDVYTKKNYEEIAMQFFKYIREKYTGFQLDAVYSEENKEAICFMKSIGARCHGIDIKMRLRKNEYHSSKSNKKIIPLSEKYYEDFCRLHDENHPDVYWNGERILSALDRYDVLIAVEKDELVGSVVCEFGGDKRKYISFIETDKRYRRQGHAKSLLGEAIDRAFLSDVDELALDVEIDNNPAICLYKSFGFQKVDASSLYSIESL